MFELFFVITLSHGVVLEDWELEFNTKRECEQDGYLRASLLMQDIQERYPDLKKFGILCQKNNKQMV